MKLLSFFIVGIVLLSLPGISRASQMNPLTDLGLTARGIAMGNAMTAVSDDPGLIYHNPAAMALMDKHHLSLGYLFAKPQLQGGPKGDLHDFDESNNMLLESLVLSLRSLLKSRRPLALGLFMNFDRNGEQFIHFRAEKHPKGDFPRYGKTSTLAVMSMGVGITDWLYLGGGALVTLHGTTDFTIRTDLAGNTEEEGMVLDSRLVYSPIVSFFLDFESVDLGATYRAVNYGKMGDIIVDAEATVGDSHLADLPMVLIFQDSYFPQNLSLGLAIRLRSDLNLALDGTWFNWGGFDDQVSTDDLPHKNVELDFVDTYVPRLGLEYFLTESFPLRLGYQYSMTPMRKPGGNGNIFLDSDKHIGSLGLGYTFQDSGVLAYPISFDATYLHQYLVPNSFSSTDSGEDRQTFESKGNVNAGVFSCTVRF